MRYYFAYFTAEETRIYRVTLLISNGAHMPNQYLILLSRRKGKRRQGVGSRRQVPGSLSEFPQTVSIFQWSKGEGPGNTLRDMALFILGEQYPCTIGSERN